MQTNHTLHFNKFLMPLSFLYGIGVKFRNQLFDRHILHSEEYDVPIICIGNLAVGGTGKTPHTEYLIQMLRKRYHIAVLSRGYKRETKGFILASDKSTSAEIGDEPLQIKRKFPDILVAVNANRREGIRNLLALPEEQRPEVILLDDAFQHRYVTPSLNILLSDCHCLYTKDKLLPAGRLREPASSAKRADIVIVTKCDSCIQPIDYRILKEDMHLSPYQHLFFSRIAYGELQPVFKEAHPRTKSQLGDSAVLLVSGIAAPQPFEEEVHNYTHQVSSLTFPDHHKFDQRDIQRIMTAFGQILSKDKIIIVTEKDAARLRDMKNLPQDCTRNLYFLPITINFCMDRGNIFEELIIKHIKSKIKNHTTR